MQKTKNNKQSGSIFAGLLVILALIFPALSMGATSDTSKPQSSNNTLRRNDISKISVGIAEFQANNNGKSPSTPADLRQVLDNTGTMDVYTGAKDVELTTGSKTSAPNPAVTIVSGTSSVRIYTGAKCNSSGGTSTGIGATSRQIAIHYAEEVNGAPKPACEDV